MNRNPNGMDIAALVLGIMSIPLSCYHATLGLVAAIIGIVIAVKAKRRSNSGMALAGFVCAIIGCVFGALNLLGGLILLIFALVL